MKHSIGLSLMLLLLSTFVSNCGIRGDTSAAPPLWGEAKREYERQQAEEERKKREAELQKTDEEKTNSTN